MTYLNHRNSILKSVADAIEWCSDKKKRRSVIRSYDFFITFPHHMLVLQTPEHDMGCWHQTTDAIKHISYQDGLREISQFFNLAQFVEYDGGIEDADVLAVLHDGNFTVCQIISSLPRFDEQVGQWETMRERRRIVGFQSDEQALRYMSGPMGKFMKPMVSD